MEFMMLTLGGVVIIFAAIRFFRLHLYAAVFLAVIAVSLLAGLSPGVFLAQVKAALTSASTYRILSMTIFAAYFGALMLHTGHIDAIFAKPQHTMSPANALAFVPMLMGFLLSPPGGSRASSQVLIGLFEPQDEQTTAELTVANIWFRLCGRFLSPFIPAVTLLYELLGLQVFQTILLVLPINLLMIVLGRLFLVGRSRSLQLHESAPPPSGSPYFLSGLLPLLVAFAAAFAGLQLSLCLPLGVVAAYIEYRLKHHPPLSWRQLLHMLDWRLGMAVIAICTYNNIIAASGTLPDFISLAAALVHSQALLTLVLLAVALILGYCMGSVVGSIGVTIPVMLALGNGNAFLLAAIVYVGTNIGCYMLSPLNTDYLSAQDILSCSFTMVYRKLALPVGLALIGIFLYALLMLHWLAA